MEANRTDILLHTGDFIVKPLESNIDLSGFCSEYSSYTDFLKKLAPVYDESKIFKTYLIMRKTDEKIIAYFSIMPGSVSINKDTRPVEVPIQVEELGTLHVHHLAADKESVSEYKHIVKFILLLLRDLVINKLSQYLNINYISLDADVNENPDIEHIYENAGFKSLGTKGELPSMICPVYE